MDELAEIHNYTKFSVHKTSVCPGLTGLAQTYYSHKVYVVYGVTL